MPRTGANSAPRPLRLLRRSRRLLHLSMQGDGSDFRSRRAVASGKHSFQMMLGYDSSSTASSIVTGVGAAQTLASPIDPPELLRQLIRFDTSNPPGGERE